MEDSKIIDLYWARSEDAISETDLKYGKYCRYIAYNVLYCEEDTEECVNDTYVRAWNCMPPHKPQILSSFLGKITRNLALDRLAYNNAQKRKPEMQCTFDELAECLPAEGARDTENDITENIVINDVVNKFLKSLPLQTRVIFMRRYWYMSSINEIAEDYGVSESKVKVTLHRARKKFKELLEKEGVSL